MILTCPNCATRYSTTAEAIGANGRTVRCSNCEKTWFVTMEPDILDLKQQEKEEQRINDAPKESARSEVESSGFGLQTQPVTGAHVQIRDMADQRRRNRSLMGVSMIWFVTIAILAMGILYAFLNRQAIVERYNASASIYKALGINVKSIGLEFEDPTIRRLPIDGVETLVINGHIVNISDETRPIPMLELSILNKANEKLASWVIDPPQAEIEAGGRIAYTSEYQNPPVDGQEVEYRFVTEDEWVDPAPGVENDSEIAAPEGSE